MCENGIKTSDRDRDPNNNNVPGDEIGHTGNSDRQKVVLIRSAQLDALQKSAAAVVGGRRYNTDGNPIKFENILVFSLLHLLALNGLCRCLFINMNANLFTFIYGYASGLGITAGAHRLWAHKSYRARLPLRIFLMLCNSAAGQWDIYDWSRDHRVHHRFTETDADPHNSHRGYFFAHIGWLCTKKHPSVRERGQNVDLSDILADPVVRFQRTYYNILYPLMVLVVPMSVGVGYFGLYWWDAFTVMVTLRYLVILHSTWLVNSAAHMWGDKPYNQSLRPSENPFVSYGALGEGFHNYHHAFPQDYRTSELGWRWNLSALFIDLMAAIGQVTERRIMPQEMIAARRARVAAFAQ